MNMTPRLVYSSWMLFEFPVRFGDGQATKRDWESCSMPQMRLGHDDIDNFLALKHFRYFRCEISLLGASHCFFCQPRMTLEGVFSRTRDYSETGGTGGCFWDHKIHVLG
jgi:hypothetical protein